MHLKKITYEEVKLRQQTDIKRKRDDWHWTKDLYNFYRNFSTPFTYMFVRLGISSSAVSILNFFPNIVGFFFLSMGTYTSIIIGLLYFILFKTLDCSDGEVARIQNSELANPQKKITEGSYFDSVGHFIEPICLAMGLGIGLFHLYSEEIYLILGVILAVILTLEFALNELVRSYFRRGIIERKIELKEDLKFVQKQLMEKIGGKPWSGQNIFLKTLGIYPQGLVYSREFFDPILIFLAIVEYILHNYIGFAPVLYGYSWGILPAYAVIVGIVKLIKISRFILKLKKREYITGFLNELQ